MRCNEQKFGCDLISVNIQSSIFLGPSRGFLAGSDLVLQGLKELTLPEESCRPTTT